MGYLELDGKKERKLNALKESAEEFGRNLARPAGIKLDKSHNPASVIDKDSELWDVFRGFRARGLHKVMIPKAYGGTFGSLPSKALALLNEEMGYADS